jgi:hypothetical protein
MAGGTTVIRLGDRLDVPPLAARFTRLREGPPDPVQMKVA